MKKITAILMALAMILSFAACGEKKEEAKTETNAEIANPVVSYDSLEKINGIVGCNLTGTGAMGTTDESFSVTDGTLAEYRFAIGGNTYTYRAAKTDEDISGIYYNEALAFAAEELSDDLVILDVAEGLVARWFSGDMQYVLYKDCSQSGELDHEGFIAICNEYIAQTCPEIGDFFNKLTGEYADSVGQRAGAAIESFGNYAQIEIQWSSSASETDYWFLKLKKDGEKYTYENGTHGVVTSDEMGIEISSEVKEDNLSGYFELADGNALAWTGAADEVLKTCVFEKIPE